jgi:DNA polymerase I
MDSQKERTDDVNVPAVGPKNAKIMLVGEAPGEQEVIKREPFVGASGSLLNEMLHDAEILRSECFITNVCRERPPNNDISLWIAKSKKDITSRHVSLGNKYVFPAVAEGYQLLVKEIDLVKPNIIVAFGNVAMWALTGRWGIKSWRGSLLQDTVYSRKCIPTYHPAYILRDYAQRHITTHDLRRARREAQDPLIHGPEYRFILRPKFEDACAYLSRLKDELLLGPRQLSVDIETRAGHIACLGIATSPTEAICIPFMCVENREGYWNEEEEFAIIKQLKSVLTHENARIIGQNFIYDSQYIWRHWRFVPNFHSDTMLGHHACFTGLPKGLDYLSSLYCANHVYWKDEGKNWEPKVGEEQLWAYNCKDCVVTYEADAAIQSTTASLGLVSQGEFQQAMFWPVLQAMVRGVRVDRERRKELAVELRGARASRDSWLQSILGHPINIRSPLQLKKLFYEDFGVKEIFNRKTGAVTLNDEALQKIATREPLLRPLVQNISEQRSLGVFLSTFVEADLDADGRLRCSYNIAGTETLRLSSSENAFGSGLNLQNLPKGTAPAKAQREGWIELPNIRKIFIPDSGYTFFDGDLERADLLVVIEEAGDADLRAMVREGADIHTENAKLLFETSTPTPPQREQAKRWVHGTNYGGGPRTMAVSCGITVHMAEKLQQRWFAAHPGILEWHTRTASQLRSKRMVQNAFGYRRYYFDRPEGLLGEALAWIPQSTVACYINRIWLRVYELLPDVQVLLQVHDSLAGQMPSNRVEELSASLLDIAGSVSVPYPDPLVIPFKLKTSPISWGDCA